MKEKKEITGLVSGEDLLVALFPTESSRPTLRWLRDRQADRSIPYVKIGRLVRFDVEQCRAFLFKTQIKKP